MSSSASACDLSNYAPYHATLRTGNAAALRCRYGCCAGKEQAAAGVENRREGIPALVIVRPDGSEVLRRSLTCRES